MDCILEIIIRGKFATEKEAEEAMAYKLAEILDQGTISDYIRIDYGASGKVND